MPIPLIAVGLTVEAQAATPAGQPWNPLGQVQSISGSSQSMDFTEITGKSDTITQRVPNRLTPGTVTFSVHMWAEAQTAYAAWRNAMLNLQRAGKLWRGESRHLLVAVQQGLCVRPVPT